MWGQGFSTLVMPPPGPMKIWTMHALKSLVGKMLKKWQYGGVAGFRLLGIYSACSNRPSSWQFSRYWKRMGLLGDLWAWITTAYHPQGPIM